MMLDWKPRRPDMLIDSFGFGKIVEDGFVFCQNFSIRSYEIGADRTASIETLMNHLQETALNHVKSAGLLGDGFGSTPEMCKKNLIWVVTKMQVLVDRYPTWLLCTRFTRLLLTTGVWERQQTASNLPPKHPISDVFYRALPDSSQLGDRFFIMVATAATSAFFPVASPPPDSGAKTSSKLGGPPANVDARGIKSKSAATGGLQVKANAQAPSKVNGTKVGVMEGLKSEDDSPSLHQRTFINQLPDWSMLLAAVTTIFLAAEKQWMMLDWKPRRPDMLIDSFGFGKIVEDGFVFRQNFSIRSYEIGADRTASIETLMNHLQETALNHVKSAGLLGDGFGSTPEMCKKNLIWVVTKMQVLVDRYPTWKLMWCLAAKGYVKVILHVFTTPPCCRGLVDSLTLRGDVVQVDTLVAASGKNGMRCDWLVRDCRTGDILTRASSVWVMMNKETRRLSKIPNEVRGEMGTFFVDSPPVVDEDSRKLLKLDESTADYIRNGLTPRWSDLDVNQHVNNVKYIGWILELYVLEIKTWGKTVMEVLVYTFQQHNLNNAGYCRVHHCQFWSHELCGMTLEYRRECGRDSVLQSLTTVSGGGVGSLVDPGYVECQHLLRLEGGAEIVKGRTEWRPKYANCVGTLGSLPAESS
ncbi:hypothetical protein TEA_012708 [Camellia sinensis var. sinensis]|uniref:Acyl-[acyl-carrier-protein] hydrolase n=1 Tax=Camellia sinensis var. sinensis TaxID=542762 RepID=A0A4S4EQ36_CAMSN|nr:hypothetical protein TEA_012708 [Camellia sinensis var. sinensis]